MDYCPFFPIQYCKYPCGTSCVKDHPFGCLKSATSSVHLLSYTFDPPSCPLNPPSCPPLNLPKTPLPSSDRCRGGIWDVGRSRVALSCSMADGIRRYSRWNHCHFGVTFIKQYLLSSANIIDYTQGFVIMASRVMDTIPTALLCAMRMNMSLLLAKSVAVIL